MLAKQEPGVIGETLGRFRIVATIGEGGMGTVYRAHDDLLSRDVAVKVLKRDRPAELPSSQDLLSEARASSALSHPNICTIYEVGETEGNLYIVMELVEGTTLNDVFDCLWRQYPGLRDRIITEQGQVRIHINIFVGDENIRYLNALATSVPADAVISIIPAVSGGLTSPPPRQCCRSGNRGPALRQPERRGECRAGATADVAPIGENGTSIAAA